MTKGDENGTLTFNEVCVHVLANHIFNPLFNPQCTYIEIKASTIKGQRKGGSYIYNEIIS